MNFGNSNAMMRVSLDHGSNQILQASWGISATKIRFKGTLFNSLPERVEILSGINEAFTLVDQSVNQASK